MNKVKNIDIEQIETKMHSVGIDLTLIDSIIKYIDMSLNEEIDVSNIDVANLTIVLKRLVKILKSKYDKLERILNL